MRWTDPAPSLAVAEVAESSAVLPTPKDLPTVLFSRPRALGRPKLSVLARERLVSLLMFAWSVTLTFTVRMSPSLAAR